MLDFLKLVRFPNLLILAFTQYVIRWSLLAPYLAKKRYELDYSVIGFQMTEFDFFLLVLSTVMIAAAGYIINDYFDIRIDEVNRPASNLVGKTIKRRVAMALHMTLNILGVLIGLWISWKYGMFRAGSFIYLAAPTLLWFYSTSLKRQFLIGNVVIALLSSLIPLLGVIYELTAISRAFPTLVQQQILQLDLPLTFALGYTLFAFLVSLIREIVKDIEDYEGDMEYGCKTLPIVLGINRAKWVVITLTTGLFSALCYMQYVWWQLDAWNFFFYVLVLLQLPVIYLAYRNHTATGKKDWKLLSGLLKYIMLAGVSFLFLYAHEINSNIN
ncbi:MAG TPA: geranylgeranylglycerol-phosphate geranylgeranyltransferase [Bacteroidia bacterium]|nr:geranylgeranylglycerol-phosphate geranylgeranyltransferase [Bacteroidia bacterium]